MTMDVYSWKWLSEMNRNYSGFAELDFRIIEEVMAL